VFVVHDWKNSTTKYYNKRGRLVIISFSVVSLSSVKKKTALKDSMVNMATQLETATHHKTTSEQFIYEI